MIGTEPCVGAIDELLSPEHLCELFLKRDGCRLFALVPGNKAHGKGDPVTVHEQPHFNDGVGTVLLAHTVFSDPFYDLPGHFIHVIFIGRFCFKIEVGAVVITDGGIPPDYFRACLIQMADVGVVVLFHDVHSPQYMDIVKGWLLIVFRKMQMGAAFRSRLQDPRT